MGNLISKCVGACFLIYRRLFTRSLGTWVSGWRCLRFSASDIWISGWDCLPFVRL